MDTQGTITDRWFQAYDDLRMTGRVTQRGVCRDLGIDRRNFAQQAADHSRRILRVEWLSYLVLNHGVSADWLLTGRGWPFGQ
jgi:hypothetical protein